MRDDGRTAVDQLLQRCRDLEAPAVIVQIFSHRLDKRQAGQPRDGPGQARPPADAKTGR